MFVWPSKALFSLCLFGLPEHSLVFLCLAWVCGLGGIVLVSFSFKADLVSWMEGILWGPLLYISIPSIFYCNWIWEKVWAIVVICEGERKSNENFKLNYNFYWKNLYIITIKDFTISKMRKKLNQWVDSVCETQQYCNTKSLWVPWTNSTKVTFPSITKWT